MTWICNNWSLIVVVLCFLGLSYFYSLKFLKMDKKSQMEMLREWLLYCVIIVEREYQSGTGQLKLRAAWDMFIERFPNLVAVVSFEMFSKLVDEALEKMRQILETNKDIESYVNGDENGK